MKEKNFFYDAKGNEKGGRGDAGEEYFFVVEEGLSILFEKGVLDKPLPPPKKKQKKNFWVNIYNT